MLQKEVIDRMVARPVHLRLQPPERDAAVALRDAERAVRAARELRPASARGQCRGAHGAAGPAACRRCCQRLGEIVQVAFSQRRKIMRHTLGKWLEQKGFTGEFDAQRRAEEVPVDEYVALAQAVLK
jgi:16S rRNA (adenine1518-N6/adenine1519-N6)-dimethyltransferase